MPWVKVDCNLEMDRRFRKLTGVGRAVLQFIWRLAKKNEGMVKNDDWDPEYVADMTCFADMESLVETSMNDIVALGFVEIFENGPHYFVSNWSKMQTPKDRTNATRQRKHREKKKKEKVKKVTVSNDTVTDSNGVTERYITRNAVDEIRVDEIRVDETRRDICKDVALILPIKKPKKPKKSTAKSTDLWNAYKTAYEIRYNTLPIRSASVNATLCNIVNQVGSERACRLATFYLTLSDFSYVRSSHDTKQFIYNIQKINTAYETGCNVTHRQAMDIDKRQSSVDDTQSILEDFGEYLD